MAFKPSWGTYSAFGGSQQNKLVATPSFSNTTSMLLDGVDEHVNFGSTINDMTGLTPFTFSVWVKMGTIKTQGILQNDDNAEGFRILQAGSSGFSFWMTSAGGGAGNIRLITLSTVATGTWYNLVITSDGSGNASGVKMYVNNVDTSATTFLDTFTGPMAATKDLFAGLEFNSDPARDFDGNFDDFAIWKTKELTVGEVGTVWNSGSAGDISSLSPDWYVKFGDDALDDATAGTGNIQDQIGTGHGVPVNTNGDEFVLDVS